MTIYQFNEGSIVVADELVDRTMHILAPRPGATDFTLLVSHDATLASHLTTSSWELADKTVHVR